MKKLLVVAAALVFAFAAGSAFAADQKTNAKPYNGITYFDLGSGPGQLQSVMTAENKPAGKPFNGVTYFDQGQPRVSAENYAVGSAAGGLEGKAAPEKRPFNGITFFN